MSNNAEQRPIYRIVFTQEEEIKELYAQYISEETLVGFIEADTLLDRNNIALIVNPKEVRRCYIPLHNILRIDEITVEQTEKSGNVSHLSHALKKTFNKK